jgi:acetylglutamate kinase
MGVEKLVYLTDQHGVLDTDKNLIPKLSSGAVKKLIDEKVVVGGMLAKTRAILSALQGGVKDVQILNANTPKILLESVIYGEALGTRITGEAS